MYDGMILSDRWLKEHFPEEADEVKELFHAAGWQTFCECLMPSADMLDGIASKRFVLAR